MTSNQDMPLNPAQGKKKLSRKQKVTNIIGLTIIALILGAVLYFARNNAASAEVGDCIKETGPNSITQVDCNSGEAQFKVVGRVNDKSQSEATLTTCSPYAGAVAAYWEKSGGTTFVLCLASVSK